MSTTLALTLRRLLLFNFLLTQKLRNKDFKNNKGGQPGVNISGTATGSKNDNSNNDGVSSTGIAFNFHGGSDYQKLTLQQRKELYDCRFSPCDQMFTDAERKTCNFPKSSLTIASKRARELQIDNVTITICYIHINQY